MVTEPTNHSSQKSGSEGQDKAKKNQKQAGSDEVMEEVVKHVIGLTPNEIELAIADGKTYQLHSMVDGSEGGISDLRPKHIIPERQARMRKLVRSFYDMQLLRMAFGLRLVADTKRRMGMVPGVKETNTMGEDEMKTLDQIRRDFRRITDKFAAMKQKPEEAMPHGVGEKAPGPKKQKKGKREIPSMEEFVPEPDSLISDYTSLVCAEQYFTLLAIEEKAQKQFAAILTDYPIYNQWLSKITGCGDVISGVIIAEIDIAYTKYVSSLWKWCGVAVMKDKTGQSKRKEHLVPVEYKRKNGELDVRNSITFNPILKTKMVGVFSGSLMIHNEYFKLIYDNYRGRLEQHPVYGIHNDGKINPAWVARQKNKPVGAPVPGENSNCGYMRFITSKARRNAMAKRYIIKQFLKHLYINWKRIEGLPAMESYEERRLGLKPHNEFGECAVCHVPLLKNELNELICPCGEHTGLLMKAKKAEEREAKKAARNAAKAAGNVVPNTEEDDMEGTEE